MARGLDRIIARMKAEIAEIKRAQANIVRSGRVIEIDAARGLARLEMGHEGSPMPSPWIRWTERAGARKTWNPPSPGELMTVLSPGGEVGENSLAVHGGFTDANPPPSSDGDATVYTLGPVTLTITGAGVVAAVGGVSFTLSSDGTETTGGRVSHNGTTIGDDHTHSGITTGPARTGDPK